jgi:hypothetical protein
LTVRLQRLLSMGADGATHGVGDVAVIRSAGVAALGPMPSDQADSCIVERPRMGLSAQRALKTQVTERVLAWREAILLKNVTGRNHSPGLLAHHKSFVLDSHLHPPAWREAQPAKWARCATSRMGPLLRRRSRRLNPAMSAHFNPWLVTGGPSVANDRFAPPTQPTASGPRASGGFSVPARWRSATRPPAMQPPPAAAQTAASRSGTTPGTRS